MYLSSTSNSSSQNHPPIVNSINVTRMAEPVSRKATKLYEPMKSMLPGGWMLETITPSMLSRQRRYSLVCRAVISKTSCMHFKNP